MFDVKNGEKVFVGVVSDTQWKAFCEAFDLADWANDTALAANNTRVARRDEIIPRLKVLFASFSKEELMARLEKTGLPFAPITRPEDLLKDPHLLASDGLLDMEIPEGRDVSLPALPLSMDGHRPGLRRSPPRPGEHSFGVLRELGLSENDIRALAKDGMVGLDIQANAVEPAE